MDKKTIMIAYLLYPGNRSYGFPLITAVTKYLRVYQLVSRKANHNL